MSKPVNATQDLIDRLGEAALDCRAAVREAHEATRDLRQAKRDLETALAGFRASLDRGKQEAVEHVTEVFSEQTVIASCISAARS